MGSVSWNLGCESQVKPRTDCATTSAVERTVGRGSLITQLSKRDGPLATGVMLGQLGTYRSKTFSTPFSNPPFPKRRTISYWRLRTLRLRLDLVYDARQRRFSFCLSARLAFFRTHVLRRDVLKMEKASIGAVTEGT